MCRCRWADAGCADRAVRLWDTTTLRCVRTLLGHGAEVSALAASPQQGADLGISADRGGAVLLWRAAGDAPARAGPALDSAVMCLALSPAHASLAAAGCASGAVVLLDLMSGTAVKRLAAHAGEVHAATFVRISGGGVLMATAGRDRAVHLWRIDSTPASATLRRTHHVPKAGPNVSDAQRERLWVALAWLPQQVDAAEHGGTLQLAGSGFGGDVMVWDVTLATLAVSAPHKLGACGCLDASIDLQTAAQALTAAHVVALHAGPPAAAHTRSVFSIAAGSASSRRFALTISMDRGLVRGVPCRLWLAYCVSFVCWRDSHADICDSAAGRGRCSGTWMR
jgi:WD40 repeat protein